MLVEHDLHAQLVGVLVLVEVAVVEIVGDLGVAVTAGEGHAHGPVPFLRVVRQKGIGHFGEMIGQHIPGPPLEKMASFDFARLRLATLRTNGRARVLPASDPHNQPFVLSVAER